MSKNYSILNGLKTYVFNSRQELINFVVPKKSILIAINAEKIINKEESLQKIINDNVGYADGIGAVWALKRHGFKHAIKIPGCELWLDIIADVYKQKSFYLIGAEQEIIENTIVKLNNQFPGIQILNYRNGFINSNKEKTVLLEDIKIKKPDIVFVATGSPKQEFLMKAMFDNYPALYMGLGGSFDVYVDHVKRAPQVYIKLNLEWFYRLLKQPSRIGRQVFYIRFIWMLLFNKI